MEIRSYLAQGAPLLFDGAMGTYYASFSGRASESCERACLEHPEEILAIHRAYLEAGCQAVKTNTFSVGTEFSQGNGAAAEKIIEAACCLALEAAKPYDALVFADLGPAPRGAGLSPGELYRMQADRFLDQGLTCFLAETLPTDEGIADLARYLKERCPESFLIVSYAVGSDGITQEGQTAADLFRRTAGLPGVDSVGLNCVSGPHHMLEMIQNLDCSGLCLSVMPNAGYPSVLGRRPIYQGKPDYFAGKMLQMVQAGASILGGCCGTTPSHIARTAAVLADSGPVPAAEPGSRPSRTPGRVSSSNPFWEKLESGKRVAAVELDPPTDDRIGSFLKGVSALHRAGADVITIADCPVGRPRADSCLLACRIKRDLKVEPLPHMTCRDRNLNATKALLLGLSMEDVHNVLLVTGDPIPSADRDEVKSVFNFNSRKLARFVSQLNESTLTTPFRIFGALNLNAPNFQIQLQLAQEKEANGMDGFLTQPVLSPEALENLKLARSVLKGKILAGIYPVVSHRNACFLNNEIAGMHVCDEIISLYEGKSREEAEHLAARISVQIIREVQPFSDGIYLMTPFQRVGLVSRILQEMD